MRYSLFFDEKIIAESKAFENEVKVDDLYRNNSGRVTAAICNDVQFNVGYSEKMIYHEGVGEAMKSIAESSREELIDLITRTLFGFNFDWIEEAVDENSDIEKIRAVALAQSQHDFSAFELFTTNEQRNQQFINAMTNFFS